MMGINASEFQALTGWDAHKRSRYAEAGIIRPEVINARRWVYSDKDVRVALIINKAAEQIQSLYVFKLIADLIYEGKEAKYIVVNQPTIDLYNSAEEIAARIKVRRDKITTILKLEDV